MDTLSTAVAWVSEHWRALLAVIEVLWILWLSAFVLLEQRSPVSTLAWILGLAALPVVGFVVYYSAGPRRLVRRQVRRRGAKELVAQLDHSREAAEALASEPQRPLMRLMEALGASPPEPASRVQLFSEGDAVYEAIIEAIAGARSHVHVEYYIFGADRAGSRVKDVLCEQARKGVAVRLLVDGMGTGRWPRAWNREFKAAGVKVAHFNSPQLRLLRRSLMNFRTHRKIVIVDGRVGFTGGINVCDDHSRLAKGDEAWRDTHVCVEGNAVHGLQRVFLEDWSYATRTDPSSLGLTVQALFPFEEPVAGEAVQIVGSGPDQDRNSSEALYLDAISRATQRIWLTTPYFVPTDPLISALSNAAQRGVDVRLLLPKKTDNLLVDAASRTWWTPLLGRGLKLYEYQPRMVHAKTAVIDDWLAIVGSANLDYRSLRLNFEVGAILYGRASIEALAKLFEADLARCHDVKPLRPAFFRRLGQSAARVLAPQL